MALQTDEVVRVAGIQSRPELNGTFRRLGKQLDNGRFETTGRLWDYEWKSDPAQELALKRENLEPMPPLMRQLFHYLERSLERYSPGGQHLEAHRGALPLLYFATYKQLRIMLGGMLGDEASGTELLAQLQQAVRGMPGFELCRGGTCVRREGLEHAEEAEDAMDVDGAETIEVLRVPAAAGALPTLERLPARPDYLHVLTEALGTPTLQLVPLAPPKGQKVEQPVLYAGVDPAAAADTAPANALASELVGAAVRGDALLASAELELGAAGRPAVRCRRPVGVADLEARLAKRAGGPVGFVAFKYARALLGAWAVPRAGGGAAKDKRFAEGAWAWEAMKGPKLVLNEYMTFKNAKGHEKFWTRPVHPPDDDDPQPKETPPFVCTPYCGWPAGAALPEGAVVVDEDEEGRVLQLPDGCHASTKKGAENAAAVVLLEALQALEPAAPPLRFLALRAPALYSAADAETAEDAAAAAAAPADAVPPLNDLHADGTMLQVSLRLARLAEEPPEGAAPPPWAAVAATPAAAGGGQVLEGDVYVELKDGSRELSRQWVLLGGRVLAVEVEDLLREMTPGTEAATYARVQYHGVECWCALHAQLHALEPPPEEVVCGAGAGGHAEARLELVASLVAAWRPASLADVGCNQGKLLVRLLQNGVPGLRQMVGLEPDPKPKTLRRAAERVAAARDAEVAAGRAPPAVALYRGGLEEAWRLVPRCEALCMVEVVEHLDPPQLESVGELLLGRARPRYLVVTTPNKEWNLNQIPDPNPPGMPPLLPPPVSTYPLRNADHRFEWTRLEFRQWAEGLARAHGYRVSLHGVGGGPLDEVAVYGAWRGVGPITQVAVFEALHPPPAAHDPPAAPPLQAVWSSGGGE